MIICGIDEAGRGPLAGPVVAAAVILPKKFPVEILADSKVLTAKKREAAAALVRRTAVFAVAEASPEEIDTINILHASLLAMKRALDALPARPDKVLIDGNRVFETDIPCEAIVRGDSLVPEIMAASILAKTARDALMKDLARVYPAYGFERHSGYPTREHQEALRDYGPCAEHRKSFRLSYFD
jgi:ribonuclease HII